MDGHLKTKALPTEYNLIDRSINATDTVLSYFPFYDNNGNITRYCDAQGNVVASYTYDAFGNTIAQSGPMADIFSHRFSTKYFDAEIGLYYYGYRFYSPLLMRWLNRDPIKEQGGENLYAFCRNNAIVNMDLLGMVELHVVTRRKNNFWQQMLNNGDKYTIVSVNSKADISIGDDFSSRSINGMFDHSIIIDDCDVTITVIIYLNNKLVRHGAKDSTYIYTPHWIKNGQLAGGTGKMSDGSPEFRDGVLAHELGHAEAFLTYTIPLFRKKLERFGNRRLSDSDKIEVKRMYNDCLKETLDMDAKMSNDAHTNWYGSHGINVEIQ